MSLQIFRERRQIQSFRSTRHYKKGINKEDSRRKREEHVHKIRKDKREERLQKKRNINGIDEDITLDSIIEQKV